MFIMHLRGLKVPFKIQITITDTFVLSVINILEIRTKRKERRSQVIPVGLTGILLINGHRG